MATQLPKNGDLSQLLGEGENPHGYVAQTCNGTLVNGRGGDGCSKPWTMADGERWNHDPRPGVPGCGEGGMFGIIGGQMPSSMMPGAPYDIGATLPRRVKRR